MSRPVSSCRIGEAGAGKTLSCVIFACEEFLPFEEGRLISNLPFRPEKIADRYAGAKGVNGPMSREDILARFEPIPEEVLKQWADEKGGPWEYFHGKSIAACHIMLDEAHNFVGKRHTAKWRKAWQGWLGELRHQGATIEFVTQAEGKLAPEFKEEVGRQVFVASSESRREPVFKIEMGDIYQFLAKLIPSRGYHAATWVTEKRNAGAKKWVVERESKFTRDAKWFELYDSYNSPHAGGVSGRRKLQYEVLSWPRFLVWFLTRNITNILLSKLSKVMMICVLLGTPYFRNGMLRMAFGDGAVEKPKPQPVKSASLMSRDPEPTLAPGGDMVLDANRTTQAIGNVESQVRRSEALSMEQKDMVIRELQEARAEQERAFELNQEFVGIVGDDLLMRNGDRYAVNEVITTGPLQGIQVVQIDRRRRELLLSDGRRIKLGGVPKPVPESRATAARSSGVPGTGSDPAPALQRGSVSTTDESGRNYGRSGGRRSLRGGAANGAGVGVGPMGGVSGGGPLIAPKAGGAAAAVGDSR